MVAVIGRVYRFTPLPQRRRGQKTNIPIRVSPLSDQRRQLYLWERLAGVADLGQVQALSWRCNAELGSVLCLQQPTDIAVRVLDAYMMEGGCDVAHHVQ